jgi:hypothetical protein
MRAESSGNSVPRMVKTWTWDRRDWGLVEHPDFIKLWSLPGPWHDEPDKVQWVHADLDCLMVRSHHGNWCGYVGVPPGHAFHGRDYGGLDEMIEVHGGLTFADSCNEDAPEGHGICHIPEPGRPADVWWFGFDCNHAFDVAPRMLLTKQLAKSYTHMGTYKALPYVRGHVEHLAVQLAAIVTVIEPKAEIGGGEHGG